MHETSDSDASTRSRAGSNKWSVITGNGTSGSSSSERMESSASFTFQSAGGFDDQPIDRTNGRMNPLASLTFDLPTIEHSPTEHPTPELGSAFRTTRSSSDDPSDVLACKDISHPSSIRASLTWFVSTALQDIERVHLRQRPLRRTIFVIPEKLSHGVVDPTSFGT